ncbi:MAG: hypothetical protein ACOX5G_00165 [Kiritimatiellia bacterium]|jgi:DNA-directed RNA polymerase subunit RPC12/RpoP
MNAPYSKAKLIAELSETAKVSLKRVEILLHAMADISAREAANGVDIAALCGLAAPPPADALTFSFECPYCGTVIEVTDDCAGQAADCPICQRAFTVPFPNRSQRAATDPSELFVSFLCITCGQEIEAPIDMAGSPAECPACSAALIIPFESDPGTSQALKSIQASPAEIAAAKGRTIRIELLEGL